ncbi:hypothetical protein [Hymenobacter sublimis]|uniref:EfeO-type cupredoxin-like domain-containing protein n=1 Tax=Hymenobacter sublimis TaxID=2933777 RepID=A0ABY4JE78_9BACT|nr:hypothetical protein [Hymenobacter sublimis]UPL50051.1 hypothetical protein MWH26_03855 [Hymenobacter sublimis]
MVLLLGSNLLQNTWLAVLVPSCYVDKIKAKILFTFSNKNYIWLHLSCMRFSGAGSWVDSLFFFGTTYFSLLHRSCMRVSTPAFSLSRIVRVAGLLLALVVFAPTTSRAQTWLVSTDAYVKLGVMDKFGQLGAYTAKFVVINQETGKEYVLAKQIAKGQNGIDVIFPSEASEADYFKTDTGEAARAKPGRYTWECQVAGKKVVGGRFSFSEVANDVTLLGKN